MIKKNQVNSCYVIIILLVVIIFSIQLNLLIANSCYFQESNDSKNKNQNLLTPNAQPIKSASYTAYFNLNNSLDTDGQAYGMYVYDYYSLGYVWVADGANGIVKFTVNENNGAIFDLDSFDTGGTSYDVVYANSWGYNPILAVADGEDGLVILDPEFDPLVLPPGGSWPYLAYGGGDIVNNTRCVAVYNASLYSSSYEPQNFIYTAEYIGSNYEVEAVVLPWDANAILMGEFHQTDSFFDNYWQQVIWRVYVSGTYLYTAGWSGVDIYDISNPSTVSNKIAHCPDTILSQDVFVQGNYLYVANSNGLLIVNITNPSSPVNISSFNEFSGQPYKVFVQDNLAYLADSQGLNVIDISNPLSLEKIGSYSLPGISDIHVEDDLVFLTAGTNGFILLEMDIVEDSISISSPTSVQTGKTYPLYYSHEGDIPNIKLSLYSGGIFYRNIRTNTPNNGSFDWIVPGDIPHGTSYSIRIEDATNPSVMMTTSEFEIYTNSFSFPSSYEGVAWETGKEYHIYWNSTGYITSVDLQLLKEGGVVHDIVFGTENDGIFNWTVDATINPSTGYQLKISEHGDPSISLTSEMFSIRQVNEFWNELWFWGLILLGVVMLFVITPAVIKRRRFAKLKRKFEKINQDFVLLKDVTLFVSYSHKDASRFKIPDMAEQLGKKPHVNKVNYSQKDAQKNWVEYMNKKMGESDGLVLFCSKNSISSKNVQKEWMAAMAADKPVIPVFKDQKYIPPILKGELGVVFMNKEEFNSDAIYALVKNHLGEPAKRN